MTPIDELWTNYSATWSNPNPQSRAAELEMYLADDVTYCDPNGIVYGRDALSAYMHGYQQQVAPGSHFEIRSVSNHHDRALAHWVFRDADGSEIYTGSSFAMLSEDGRLRTITGFFSGS